MTVVGEVADAKLTSPDADASEQFYQPVAQLEKDLGAYAQPTDLNGNGGYIVLRSALPPEQMENSLARDRPLSSMRNFRSTRCRPWSRSLP